MEKVIEVIAEEVAVRFLEPSNGKPPTHFIINNTSDLTWNTTYNDVDEYEEAKRLENIYHPDMIEFGEIEDLLCKYELFNELDVVTNAESKANNKGKILRR
tara:strand:+ start:464 stop:766 length:303 start_codon:yes stop_codon:yes gene_type:complete